MREAKPIRTRPRKECHNYWQYNGRSGLSAARRCLDEYGKRSQVKASLRVDEPIERLPSDVEIALSRVLQEP